MIEIIRGPNTGPSARALRGGLTKRGIRARIVREPSGLDNYIVDHYIVNWSGVPGWADLNAHTETNKLKQLRMLFEAGLRVPNFKTEPIEGWIPRSLYHSQGQDFSRPVRADFWVKPIEAKREWRAHVFTDGIRYRVARLGWKVLDYPDEARYWNDYQGFPIRSRRFGWRIKYYDSSRPFLHKMPPSTDVLSLIDHAGWALTAQGWDMGAVDLLEGRDGLIYILEVNACPGIGDASTAKVYLDYIERGYRGEV